MSERSKSAARMRRLLTKLLAPGGALLRGHSSGVPKEVLSIVVDYAVTQHLLVYTQIDWLSQSQSNCPGLTLCIVDPTCSQPLSSAVEQDDATVTTEARHWSVEMPQEIIWDGDVLTAGNRIFIIHSSGKKFVWPGVVATARDFSQVKCPIVPRCSPPMLANRAWAATDDNVWLCGQKGTVDGTVAELHRYDVQCDRWHSEGPMPDSLELSSQISMSLVHVDVRGQESYDALVAVGLRKWALNGQTVNDCWSRSWSRSSTASVGGKDRPRDWNALPRLQFCRTNPGMVGHQSHVIVAGGHVWKSDDDCHEVSEVEILDMAQPELGWSTLCHLPPPHSATAYPKPPGWPQPTWCLLVANGMILAIPRVSWMPDDASCPCKIYQIDIHAKQFRALPQHLTLTASNCFKSLVPVLI